MAGQHGAINVDRYSHSRSRRVIRCAEFADQFSGLERMSQPNLIADWQNDADAEPHRDGTCDGVTGVTPVEMPQAEDQALQQYNLGEHPGQISKASGQSPPAFDCNHQAIVFSFCEMR